MLSAAAGLVAYGYLVGGGASVDRATLMAVVYFAGRAWDLRGPPLHALTLVAGLLTVADPLSVVDPASLLTFGATAAIVAVAPVVPLDRLPRLLRPAAAMLVATAAAEAALLPIGAAIFSRVTFAGLVLNFGASVDGACTACRHGDRADVCDMARECDPRRRPRACRSRRACAHSRTRRLHAVATWRLSPPPPGSSCGTTRARSAGVLWRGAVGGPGFGMSRLWLQRVAALSAVTAGVWIVARPASLIADGGDGRLHVTFIDVGQGDSAIVRFPRGSSLLIDAGGLGGKGSFDIGDRVVAPVLRQIGLRRLGGMVLTHGDADHIGGAPALLREFRPWDVWEGVPVPPSSGCRCFALRRPASAPGGQSFSDSTSLLWTMCRCACGIRRCPAGSGRPFGMTTRLSSSCNGSTRRSSSRETSDGRPRSTREVITTAPIRVLKVPHHGSLTSSSEPFIRALRPNVAVVSVGRATTSGTRHRPCFGGTSRSEPRCSEPIWTAPSRSTPTARRSMCTHSRGERCICRRRTLAVSTSTAVSHRKTTRSLSARCHSSSSSSRLISAILRPIDAIRDSIRVKRRVNLSFAFLSAASGSTSSWRDRFAIAKSRSPISSSARSSRSRCLPAPPRRPPPLLRGSCAPHRRDAASRSRPSARARRSDRRAAEREARRECRSAASSVWTASALLRLHFFPAHAHLVGRLERRLVFVAPEHVRVPAHQLVGDRPD